MLDSSAPSVRRGKEREKPKKKRPSAMRKLILAEIQRKREARMAKLEQEKKDEKTESDADVKQEEKENEVEEKATGVDGDAVTIESPTVESEEKIKAEIKSEETEEKAPEAVKEEIDPVVERAKKIIHVKKFRE